MRYQERKRCRRNSSASLRGCELKWQRGNGRDICDCSVSLKDYGMNFENDDLNCLGYK